MIKQIIAWDLGATKCAAAVVEYNDQDNQLRCKKQGTIKIRSCDSLEDLSKKIEALLDTSMTEVAAICIAAAGQYDGKHLHLEEGYPYPMGFASLSQQKRWPKFAIIHDYSPIVCATFTSYIEEPQNIKRLNAAAANPYGRRVALGIGTGIGMKDGILLENGDFWLGTNEIGHIGVVTPPLANPDDLKRHEAFLQFLRSEKIISEQEPLTFEKLLANQGIVRIHSFFDRHACDKSPEEIGELVRSRQAEETLSLFAWYVGLLVGTVQLAFMPDGGLWITGGVALSHLEIFDHPDFFNGIATTPAYKHLREQFPLGLLCGQEHAFMGGAYYVTKRLLN